MARVMSSNHPLVNRISVKFGSEIRIDVQFVGKGIEVSTAPLDFRMIRDLSETLDQLCRTLVLSGVTEATQTFETAVFDVIRLAGEYSETINDFRPAIEAAIRKHPVVAERLIGNGQGPENAVVSKDGPGWKVSVVFANRDTLEIGLNMGSIRGVKMEPDIRGLKSAASRTAFGLVKIKQDPKAVAEFMASVSRRSGSVEELLLNIDQAVSG